MKLNICNKCKHVQINNLIDPIKLFKNYLWETGISSSNILLIEDLVKDIKKNSLNKKYDKVLEIASNDGSCLKKLKEKLKSKVQE